jgi:hypothetical protein
MIFFIHCSGIFLSMRWISSFVHDVLLRCMIFFSDMWKHPKKIKMLWQRNDPVQPTNKFSCWSGFILYESRWNSSPTRRISSREEDLERGISSVDEDSFLFTILISSAYIVLFCIFSSSAEDIKIVTKNESSVTDDVLRSRSSSRIENKYAPAAKLICWLHRIIPLSQYFNIFGCFHISEKNIIHRIRTSLYRKSFAAKDYSSVTTSPEAEN